MHPTVIARVAYAASTAHAGWMTGDFGARAPGWYELEPWQRTALIHQVETIIAHPELDLAGLHGLFLEQKAAAGWVLGATFSKTKRRDPMLRPWAEIDRHTREQDAIVVALVRALHKDPAHVR